MGDMYMIEIASIDVQSNRVDIFGQDKGYKRRIFLIYNGIHYDPLVLSNGEDPKEDITVFESDDSNILIQFQESGDFVDLSNMNKFECDQCQTLFENQEEALV